MTGKRILICCNRTLNLGGIEKALTTFLRALNTKDNEILLVLHDKNGPLYSELPLDDINAFYLSDIQASEYLKQDIKKIRFIEVIKGIKDTVDCNITFFDKDVAISSMYLVLSITVFLLIILYIVLNKVKKVNS